MTFIKGISHHKPRKAFLFDLEDEFIFGAHRNRSVNWVLDNHPSYIAWFVNQGRLAGVRFTPAVLERLDLEKAKSNYNPDLTPWDVYIERHGRFIPPR